MMTIATIKKGKDANEIFFDMDDSGHFYVKQDEDCVVLDARQLSALSQALLAQLERL